METLEFPNDWNETSLEASIAKEVFRIVKILLDKTKRQEIKWRKVEIVETTLVKSCVPQDQISECAWGSYTIRFQSDMLFIAGVHIKEPYQYDLEHYLSLLDGRMASRLHEIYKGVIYGSVDYYYHFRRIKGAFRTEINQNGALYPLFQATQAIRKSLENREGESHVAFTPVSP